MYSPTSHLSPRLTMKGNLNFLMVGELWSDLKIHVAEPGSGNIERLSTKLRAYSSLPARERVSGSDKSLLIKEYPEYVTANYPFSLRADIHSSTGQLLVSPDVRPACLSYKTKCMASLGCKLARLRILLLCGDTELPRRLRLNFYSPATTKRICGEVDITVGSNIIATGGNDLTKMLKIGQNVVIYDKYLTRLTSYYITTIDASEIRLDRSYEEDGVEKMLLEQHMCIHASIESMK